jgi:hypothetical protein
MSHSLIQRVIEAHEQYLDIISSGDKYEQTSLDKSHQKFLETMEKLLTSIKGEVA